MKNDALERRKAKALEEIRGQEHGQYMLLAEKIWGVLSPPPTPEPISDELLRFIGMIWLSENAPGMLKKMS